MLSSEQATILKHMFLALGITICLVALVWCFPLNWKLGRLETVLLALILPTVSYIIGIGRIASLRFFDESVSNPLIAANNFKLNAFKQYLSNTHEQLFLAVVVYLILSVTLPAQQLYLLLLFSLCFVIGRILFARGYTNGASGRSLGFALTFYSNVLGFILGSVLLVKMIVIN